MRFDIRNSKFMNYAVYLDGQIEKSAIEADDVEGWVRTKKVVQTFFSKTYETYKTKRGRVHIIRMEDYDLDYYRSEDVIPEMKESLSSRNS